MMRSKWMVWTAAGLVAAELAGCTLRPAPSNSGARVEAVVPPKQNTAHSHAGLRSLPAVAAAIDRIPGLKWSVVLQEGDKVYVAAFPQYAGGAPQGAAPRAEYHGTRSYDSAAELARQTPDDWIAALEQTAPRADSYDYRPKARSGRLSPALQRTVRDTVRRALPEVRAVYITTDVASAAVLRGYAEYIEAGGDMRRFMDQFHARIAKIWPHGRGLGPDRPSASPDFGAIGTPASQRTPAPGHSGR